MPKSSGFSGKINFSTFQAQAFSLALKVDLRCPRLEPCPALSCGPRENELAAAEDRAANRRFTETLAPLVDKRKCKRLIAALYDFDQSLLSPVFSPLILKD